MSPGKAHAQDDSPGPPDPASFPYDSYPARINLGCGFDYRDGYLNVDFQDFHKPDLVADVRDLGMLPSQHYEELIAQDVLEHLPRTDVLPALKEWSRLLSPGGRLILRVPNIVGLTQLLIERQSLADQELLLQNLFGTQAYTGDFHHFAFTEVILRHYLADSGFVCAQLEVTDGWLFDVVAVRSPDNPTLNLGRLEFMALGDQRPDEPHVQVTLVREALRVARRFTDAADIDLADTRFRLAKRLLLRVMRLTTHRQSEHNRAIERAIGALIGEEGETNPSRGPSIP